LIGLLFFVAERIVFVQCGRNPHVLHFRQQRVISRDQIKRFQHTRLKRGFHRGKRHVGLFVFVIIIVFGNRVAIGVKLGAFVFLGGTVNVCGVSDGGFFFFVFTHLIAKRGLKINHVTQQNVFGQKFVAPDGDRLKCQRALAEAGDHCVSAGFDPFGNRNFAFTAQQFDAAHLAQVHAYRIVRTVQLFRRGRPKGHFAVGRRCVHHGGRLQLFVFGFFVFDNVDAHFGQHRHHVFDLFRTHLIRGQNLIQLIIRNIAFFPRLSDHLFDGGLTHIERNFGVLIGGLLVVVIFGGHVMLLRQGRG